MTALIRYDAACRAIAEAKSVDEAKEIHDKSAAMRAYAKQANNRELEIDATEIRWRAEIRLGELMAEQKETVGLAKGGQPYQSTGSISDPVDKVPTLAQVGLDKHLADRARKMAAIPAAKRESMIGEWRERLKDENHRVSTNLLREGERAQRDEALAQAPVVWPSGRYPVIYADPPWQYEHPPIGATNRSIENHYPTMTLDQICALDVGSIAADGCVLFLWATAPKMAECFDVIKSWGFIYRTNMVWVKDKIGMGYHVRNQHEILLIAKRGEIAPPEPSNRPSSVLHAPRTEHSAKPHDYYDLIDRMYPGLPKVELFARNPREGWAAWGNQANAA